MRKSISILAIALTGLCGLCGTAAAQQQKVFEWQPANDEVVRLDPANYHSGRTYHPGRDGGSIHVDISAQKPVTVFVVAADAWSSALQRAESIPRVQRLCPREHVMETTYTCELPPSAMTLVVRDERNSPDAAVFAGLGAVLDRHDKVDRAIGAGVAAVFTGSGSPTHKFAAPNDVHVQYFRWACVENCVQPEYQWMQYIKEKYELSSFMKVYGGFAPDHDQTDVNIGIKAPVPMMVALLPSDIANRLHSNPGLLETALQTNACQQRGVQKLEFRCAVNLADGPQSLVVVPESTAKVPRKKAEVWMSAVKCVANCAILAEVH
jgi:hypothetical protein